jgi:transglutaminase-like putative cysteine protease
VSWRIKVEHRSRYQYSSEVRSSYNEARVTPLTTNSQLVLDAAVIVNPTTQPYRYLDYWGSVVHAFDLHVPHHELLVVGRSVVETSVPVTTPGSISWQQLKDPQLTDDYAELLAPTPSVPLDARLLTIGNELKQGRSPHQAAEAAVAWVHDTLAYVAGTTEVHTSAVEAWEGGRGVCQDFAHLALAVVRGMGIPGRYCSGYLHPNADAGVGATLIGESHAWLEVWTGEWHAFDPTIGWPIGERHVLVARGREYADVAPLKGIYRGGTASALEVTVNLTRMA